VKLRRLHAGHRGADGPEQDVERTMEATVSEKVALQVKIFPF
jgi:hypothetical protein